MTFVTRGEGKMDIEEFKQKLKLVVQEGTVLNNPKKGTSTIKALSDLGVYYVRGKALIYISFQGIFAAFQTFLFMVLEGMGLSSKIGGKGKKGSPYFVEIDPLHRE